MVSPALHDLAQSSYLTGLPTPPLLVPFTQPHLFRFRVTGHTVPILGIQFPSLLYCLGPSSSPISSKKESSEKPSKNLLLLFNVRQDMPSTLQATGKSYKKEELNKIQQIFILEDFSHPVVHTLLHPANIQEQDIIRSIPHL